ncbi:MAG TPA: GNAT family N-acetyltransferase [Mycobacteriales bacterium]
MSRPVPAPVLERAVIGDAAAVVRLRDAAAERLLARGIAQWQPGEAAEAGFAARADAGELFVVRDGGEVVAAVVIVPSDPLIWGPRPGDAGYLHTLVIDRRRSGQGLGRRVLTLAEDRIAAGGATVARLDALAVNDGLTAYYSAAGYTEVGRRTFAPDSPWPPVLLFEKHLR